MFESKYYTVMIILSFVLLAACVAFQMLEMDEYNMFAQLMGK